MPFKSTDELPAYVHHLRDDQQVTWMTTFNRVHAQCMGASGESDEEMCVEHAFTAANNNTSAHPFTEAASSLLDGQELADE